MGNSNERKAATLGMPYGTANNRLRKMIIFDLLKKSGKNLCARCGLVIEKIDHLSIEHIKPWEGIDPNLFWDLDNVAFSHLSCNRPHTNSGGAPLRKTGPNGTSWCIGHQKFESVGNFWKDSRQWNGLQQYCKQTKIKSATGGTADTADLKPAASA